MTRQFAPGTCTDEQPCPYHLGPDRAESVARHNARVAAESAELRGVLTAETGGRVPEFVLETKEGANG